MKITDILREENIIANLQAKDKVSVIRELAEALVRSNPSLNTENVTDILLAREKLGSTGIGSGVAIPHGKLPELEEIIAGFGRSVPGVDFDAQDGEPSHLFFVLLAPEDSAGLHLKALAKLSRLLKNSMFRDRLMEAGDPASLFRIIREEDEKAS